MPPNGLPLGRLYGFAWQHNTLWFPGLKNVWTTEKDASGHHCPDRSCDSEIKSRCYSKLHVAFCLCLITMANGHQRFCGLRFQVESPRACAMHGWGEGDENRVFQRAKKGLDFKLPKTFPHEQPGWEMVISGFGGVVQQVHIRMGLVAGELCFVRVVSWDKAGQPDQVAEIARVKTKELLLTGTDPRCVLETYRGSGPGGGSMAHKIIYASANTGRAGGVYGDNISYQKYAAINRKHAAAEKLREKKAREVKVEERTENRVPPNKGRKNCAHDGMKDYKRLIKGKK